MDRTLKGRLSMKDSQVYIQIEDLKDSGLYLIFARSNHLSIWFEELGGFIMLREKGGRNFLFLERHWDWSSEDNFYSGTVKPFEEIDETDLSAPYYDKKY